ncbi:MAG TPA: nucleoside monophosphate kinase [Capsulimonadaceae bacterium]|jgi:adenylate kinase
MKFQAILLFGAPGSGKGTQGSIIGRIPGFVHIACGEIFRSLRVGSPLGRTFLDYSSRGELVPDDFTIELWYDYIEGMVKSKHLDRQSDTVVLDGIPRNVAQARLMEEYIKVKRVYCLECANREVMIGRLKRRALHENRLDDANDAVIKNRLDVYEAETAPVLDYYSNDIVRRIDTGRTPVEVLADILADIKTIVLEDPHHGSQE